MAHTQKDQAEIDKLAAEREKLAAERLRLDAERVMLGAEKDRIEAETRKIERDNQGVWRIAQSLFPSVLAAIVAAVAAYAAFVKETQQAEELRRRDAREARAAQEQRSRDELERQFRRWRTLTGMFEVPHTAWRRELPWEALAPCDTVTLDTLRREHRCGDDLRPGEGLLCRHGVRSGTSETRFRRVRCWIALPPEVRFAEEDARSYTAGIGGFDFDLSRSAGVTPADGPTRNPRLQVYVPSAGRAIDGFEVNTQVWQDTVPWMIAVSWMASGRIAAHPSDGAPDALHQ